MEVANMFLPRRYVKLLGIVVWCGLGLVGIRTSADEKAPPAADETAQTSKHAEEMGKGKSHEEAREAATKRDDAQAAKAARRAKKPPEARKHAEEMGKGKSHEEARDASTTSDQAAKATRRAKKHAEEMGKSKSHEEAREAADKK